MLVVMKVPTAVTYVISFYAKIASQRWSVKAAALPFANVVKGKKMMCSAVRTVVEVAAMNVLQWNTASL
jgi:hypothetical protein